MALDYLYLQQKLVTLEDYQKKHAGETLPLVCSECYAINGVGSCICMSSELVVFESALAEVTNKLWEMSERVQLAS